MITTATLFDVPPACPYWILTQLQREGLRDPGDTQPNDALDGHALPRWCPTCRQPIYAGFELHGRRHILDPTPTTIDGELFAILVGRATFNLSPHHRDIWPRRTALIRLVNADQAPVYLEHSCDGPAPIVNDRWIPVLRKDFNVCPF